MSALEGGVQSPTVRSITGLLCLEAAYVDLLLFDRTVEKTVPSDTRQQLTANKS